MPQANALNLIAVSILLGMSSHAIAAPSKTTTVSQPPQIAQAQSPPSQSPSQMEQDFQDRLRNAKTPEERARIQAEHDRMMQQGAVPDSGANVRTGPGMGSSAMPGGQRDSGSPSDTGAGGASNSSGGSSGSAGSGGSGGSGGR